MNKNDNEINQEKEEEVLTGTFNFFQSFYDSIILFKSRSKRLRMYETLIEYAFSHKIPDNLPVTMQQLFINIRPVIDKSIRDYKNGLKGGEVIRLKSKIPTLPPSRPPFSEGASDPNGTERSGAERIGTERSDVPHVNININTSSSPENLQDYFLWSESDRKPFYQKYQSYSYYNQPGNKYGEAMVEIFNTMLSALKIASNKHGLKFNMTTYHKKDIKPLIDLITDDDIMAITKKLVFKPDISNRPYYVLGCIIDIATNRKNQEKELGK